MCNFEVPMKTQDLPLPLRLRNALLNVGLADDASIRTWLAAPSPSLQEIPGVGPTGMRALKSWAEGANAPSAQDSTAQSDEKPAAEPSLPVEPSSRWARGSSEAPEIREIKRRGDEFRAAGGSVEAGDGRRVLTLRLEPAIQAQIGALIPSIKALPHVKELGVEVSAETVGRMALIRGLDALERAHGGKNSTEKPEKAAKSADPDPADDVPVVDPDADVYSTPDGWTKCGPNDKIPVPEAVLHDYYTQNGWFRYWGMVDGTPIYFYWSPEKRLQELSPFPGSDKSGRRVAVQTTPWGPGHVIPAKWANS